MSRRARPSTAASSSVDDDVDDSALNDLLGSDTEEVGARLSKSQSRLKERKAPAASAPPRRGSGMGDWDNDSGDERRTGDLSDEDSRDSGRRSAVRGAPPRHQRPLPTKKPSSASAGAGSATLADSMDAALFGLGPSTAASTAPIAASASRKDFSLTAPVASVSHVRSRSRTLDEDRDGLNPPRPLSASSTADSEDRRSAAERMREGMRATMDRPTPDDSPKRTRRSGLSIDGEAGGRLATAVREEADRAEKADGEQAESAVADSVSERRARYREMMKKKREERSGSIDSPAPSTEIAAAALAATTAAATAGTAPRRPRAPTAVRAEDPWSALDDPMATISEGMSAADRVAQSFAALSGPTTRAELPMPAETAPTITAATDSPQTAAADVGGAARRPMAGRRAALAAATTADPVRPTSAPVAQLSAASARSTAQPAVVQEAVPSSTAPTPSLQSWLEWLGISSASEPALLPLARKAAAMSVPAHFTLSAGVWTDHRTGRRLPAHPGLSLWKRKVEQKRLALKYNVDDDDSDEDDDAFWRESDAEPQQDSAQPTASVEGAQVPLSTSSSSLRSSPIRAAPSASALHPPAMSLPPPPPALPAEGFPVPVPTTSAVDSAAISAMANVRAESFAQQKQALTTHYASYIAQLQAALSSQSTHVNSLASLHARQLDDALAHAHRVAQAERERDASLWEQRLATLEATHRRELDGLRVALYDSKVMRGLTDTITGNVRSIEALAGRVGDDHKAREAEREDGFKLRDELLAQREAQLEQDRRRLDDQTSALQLRSDALTQQQDACRKERAGLQAELTAEQQRLHLLTSQLQSEKELFLSEKRHFLADQERWERTRLQREDELSATKELADRDRRAVEREVEEGRTARAEAMQALDAERDDLKLQRDLLALRRRNVETDEQRTIEAAAEVEVKERDLAVREETLARLGRQAYAQSQQLVRERRAMEEERSALADHRAVPMDGGQPLAGFASGAGMTWTPTLLFAPFLVGREKKQTAQLSAADMKLLEVESGMVLRGHRGGERTLTGAGGGIAWEATAQPWALHSVT